jgi:hypothetical protein
MEEAPDDGLGCRGAIDASLVGSVNSAGADSTPDLTSFGDLDLRVESPLACMESLLADRGSLLADRSAERSEAAVSEGSDDLALATEAAASA